MSVIIHGDSKKGVREVPYKDIQKLYDDFLYMNTQYFHIINLTVSLKLKVHFALISFQKGQKGFYEFPFKNKNPKLFVVVT